MKREIKFRVWDNVDYMSPPFNLEYLMNDGIEFTSDCPVMQFTGLHDKNGKEIYEGDIMKCHQADINIVHWYWDQWCYQNYHAGSLPLGDLGNPFHNGGLLACEIIGNIYENPELK